MYKKLVDGQLLDMEYGDIEAVSTLNQQKQLTPNDYDAALTEHLNAVARSRRYQDRIACAVRAAYPGPFQAEGLAFAIWMDECNALGYAVLEQYRLGPTPVPTIEEFISMMPPMVWPS